MVYESLGKYIFITSKHLHYYLNKKVDKLNITSHQVAPLVELYDNEGISQNELGELCKLDKAEVTKRLDALIEAGYITKKSCKEDARVKRLYITKKGQSIRDELRSILDKVTEILAQDFSREENIIVRQLFDRMSNNLYQEVLKLKDK
ncbi:MarR family winged helix-turn-helix transcriptional regulator [Fuchsiella alkaliacetigena]|uniref:MarR family winged helix-turn-helix transcriptional regulator n=1 Tax=Fuchsiella alkaliacetigena TaxID=957042 RepID=UPI00200AD39F|nr:MarR family transcriptional regulator [Fuchsiella alkaliacetigena]MCK8825844.1 MarR family transcriptional regulator [Fuchsiella alkaliacetigena]